MSTCVAPCLGGVSACLRIGCCLRNCKCGCHMQYLQYLCGTTNDTGLMSATLTSIELRSPGFIFTHHKLNKIQQFNMHLMQFTCKRKCISDIVSHKFNSIVTSTKLLGRGSTKHVSWVSLSTQHGQHYWCIILQKLLF